VTRVANDLVDAMSVFTIPVVLGGGKKLFADGSAPHRYKLTRSPVSNTGLLIGHYERDGAITIGATAPDAPSVGEKARRERMKREGKPRRPRDPPSKLRIQRSGGRAIILLSEPVLPEERWLRAPS
jgi:hypothetical protein